MNTDAPLLLSNKALKPFAKKLMFGLPAQDASAQHDDAKSVFLGTRFGVTSLHCPTGATLYDTFWCVAGLGGRWQFRCKALNECIPQAWAAMPVEQRPILTHQSGKQHVEALRQRYSELG